MKPITKTISESALQSVEITRHLSQAHRHLGELKGLAKTIPNEAILVNTLGLKEAQDSSEIENIITTQDEVYKHLLNYDGQNIAAKEVANYANALHFLYNEQSKKEFISINMLVEAQTMIKGNSAGVRKQAGTQLRNDKTGEVIYTPPEPNELPDLLNDLEKFINNPKLFPEIDPLIKMALIHHQFESIHPFYDGNGRIGRILNIIYLIQMDLLDTPILYLSRYINHNKQQYYNLLQSIRQQQNWNDWLVYMLQGVTKTAQSTIALVVQIGQLQQEYKQYIRIHHPKIYSQELLNNIFMHPYTKIAFVQKSLAVSRLTASRYLDQLVQAELLEKYKLGRENYYLNHKLISLLADAPSLAL